MLTDCEEHAMYFEFQTGNFKNVVALPNISQQTKALFPTNTNVSAYKCKNWATPVVTFMA
jgi:hypothetical protein